jgi:hypothetical protein
MFNVTYLSLYILFLYRYTRNLHFVRPCFAPRLLHIAATWKAVVTSERYRFILSPLTRTKPHREREWGRGGGGGAFNLCSHASDSNIKKFRDSRAVIHERRDGISGHRTLQRSVVASPVLLVCRRRWSCVSVADTWIQNPVLGFTAVSCLPCESLIHRSRIERKEGEDVDERLILKLIVGRNVTVCSDSSDSG